MSGVTPAATRHRAANSYADYSGGAVWAELEAPVAPRFPWDPESTYLRRPPFVALPTRPAGPTTLAARPLIVLGDVITTDHARLPARCRPRGRPGGG
jgi:aconitate hydratase